MTFRSVRVTRPVAFRPDPAEYRESPCDHAEAPVVIRWILLLLLALVLFGFGFTTHMLWIAAAVLLVVWLFGFNRHRRSQ
jgi:Flp pilus assembly protein TadB